MALLTVWTVVLSSSPLASAPAHAAEPFGSWGQLTTGNGFGFANGPDQIHAGALASTPPALALAPRTTAINPLAVAISAPAGGSPAQDTV